MHSDGIREEAVRLYCAGESSYEIGEKLGIRHQTVSKWAKKAGVVRGKGGGCVAKNNAHRHESAADRLESAIGDRFDVIEVSTGNWAVLRCRECGTVFRRQVDLRYPTTCFVCKHRQAEEEREKERERVREANEKRALMQRLVNILAYEHECRGCGRRFRSANPRQLFCTPSCRKKYKDRRKKGTDHIKRAKRYGVAYEYGINIDKLIERDGCRCYICGKTCTKSDRRWGTFGPDYPTIDHVIPLSKGGTHTWDNVRVACGECNDAKGDALPALQTPPARPSPPSTPTPAGIVGKQSDPVSTSPPRGFSHIYRQEEA